jgi:hypothetical protein
MNRAAVILKVSVVVVVTLLATIFLPPLMVLAAFAGAGNLPGWLVFPYYIISLCFVNTPNPPTFCLTYIECVAYGLVLGQAWIRGTLPKTTIWLVGTHVLAVLAAAIVWPYTGLVGPL